jgi:hypothetical protein
MMKVIIVAMDVINQKIRCNLLINNNNNKYKFNFFNIIMISL